MTPLFLDFETLPISGVPDGRAPLPVGFAYAVGDKAPKYICWGHPTENNTTKGDAFDVLRGAILCADALVCHNIGFDVEVAIQHFWGMHGWTDRLHWHDTQVMAFHHDPHAFSLGLKEQAAKHCGMPPDEQDELRDWLIEQKIIRRNVKSIGAHIHLCPGKLVGKYAIGDILRTRALFKLWAKKYVGQEGYERDMLATRNGLSMTRGGVLIDRARLGKDLERAESIVEQTNRRIAGLLRIDTYDPNKREEVAEAIERTVGVDLPKTPTGRRQTNKDALDDVLPAGELKALMRYGGAIAYDLKNYLRPWKVATDATGGMIHPHWSVTRSDDGGARSGRLSSSPNFQNLRGEEGTANLVESLKKMFDREYWTPQIRGLVIAPPGKIIVGRDWSQIELRLTAHYEDGPMAANYRADPNWDLHKWVVDRVRAMFGVELIRRIAKNIGFGSIYGGGPAALARQAKISVREAAEFRTMYFDALPTLRELMREVTEESRRRPITTIGQRSYRAEDPRFDRSTGEMLYFYYKMLNYLIQGSAADLMKEAMNDAFAYGIDLRLTVHDEPVAYADEAAVEDTLEAMRVSMEHNDLVSRINVPIISDGYAVKRWSLADATKKLYKGM